ncbi:MAG: hypothetical protein ACRCZF_28375, partial [Gemmataceae bacterium]
QRYDRQVTQASRQHPVDLQVRSQTTPKTGPFTELSRTMNAYTTQNGQRVGLVGNRVPHLNANDRKTAKLRDSQRDVLAQAALARPPATKDNLAEQFKDRSAKQPPGKGR